MSERLVLEILGGDERRIELPATGTLVIGCASDRVGLVIEGQGVDETHCAVGRTKEGDWAVKDLGSRYGTILNGQRVTAARLKLGDQLVLGSRRIEVKSLKAETARAAVQSVGSARPSDIPERMAGYRLERLIGKGGMGAVYLAVQESLRRPVALKVLSRKLAADRDFVHRFQAEARAAAALSHPNVVVVYDVGEENGTHFLSMEFMAGGSLEQKLTAGGPLPWKAALGVLNDAAAGLAYAESRGIVHRDIKPANLMYSGTGTVKIADLGLATTVEQEASEAVDGRKVFGTPHFIAPEQARGEAVDHRSDLYALGATAYRLLSGRTPFEGASTREILRALQTEEPRPLKEFVPDLPDELAALVQRLMQKDPAARFPTAESLRRECERLRLVAEHGPAPEVKSGSRWQALVGVLLLLIVAGASAAWYFLGRGDAPPGPAARDPRVAELERGAEPDPAEIDDGAFFGTGENETTERDEEAELRAREREAGRALRDVPAFLEGPERLAALEEIVTRFAGTEAAIAAAAEIEALRAPEKVSAAVPPLEEVVAGLERSLATLAERGAPLSEELGAIAGFRPPPELGPEFEPRREALAAARIEAHAAVVRAGFQKATDLALEGRFDELRAHLAGMEPLFEGLDELPATPEALVPLTTLRDELAQRRARVDGEEAFYLANVERAERRSVGEAVGPGSGFLAELEALDLAAVEQRLGALAPEVRARPLCRTLATEVGLARGALEALRREFQGGGWRRTLLIDPRSRKPREVREVRLDGLVVDKDGAADVLPWRAAGSDPGWWQQVFQARLARDWTPEEVRGIVAILRLAGATRGASLARKAIDPRARGLLQPAELEALRNVFTDALSWIAEGDAELRGALQREASSAARLAEAVEAFQAHSWTTAAAHLERLLAQRTDSLLIALLSDGTEWREAAPPPAPVEGAPQAADAGSASSDATGPK